MSMPWWAALDDRGLASEARPHHDAILHKAASLRSRNWSSTLRGFRGGKVEVTLFTGCGLHGRSRRGVRPHAATLFIKTAPDNMLERLPPSPKQQNIGHTIMKLRASLRWGVAISVVLVLASLTLYLQFQRWIAKGFEGKLPAHLEVSETVEISSHSGFMEGCGVAVFRLSELLRPSKYWTRERLMSPVLSGHS
jgi:hypothetical protein